MSLIFGALLSVCFSVFQCCVYSQKQDARVPKKMGDVRATTASPTETETSLVTTCTEAQSLAVATQVVVYCLIALGIVLNTAVSVLMLRNKVVGKNVSNFFIFHLSVVDLVFRVLVTAPLVYMTVGSSIENITIACKGTFFVSAMCGCATFVSLVLIALDVYKESSYTLRGNV